jgi:hypothetical protein
MIFARISNEPHGKSRNPHQNNLSAAVHLYAYHGVELDRAQLADWVGKAGAAARRKNRAACVGNTYAYNSRGNAYSEKGDYSLIDRLRINDARWTDVSRRLSRAREARLASH